MVPVTVAVHQPPPAQVRAASYYYAAPPAEYRHIAELGNGPPRVPSPVPVPIAADTLAGDTNLADTGSSDTDAPERVYVVRAGDTLWSIAAAAYGDGAAWHGLRRANPATLDGRTLADPDVLFPGERLRLPDADRLGTGTGAGPNGEPTAPAEPKPPAGPPARPEPGVDPGGVVGRTAAVAKLLAVTRAQVGKPYVFGTEGPNRFDCSGLVLYAYAQLGIKLPRVTYAQVGSGRPVALADIAPGDLVFYTGNSHVGIYVGDNQIIHASRPGRPIGTQPMTGWYRERISAIRRILPTATAVPIPAPAAKPVAPAPVGVPAAVPAAATFLSSSASVAQLQATAKVIWGSDYQYLAPIAARESSWRADVYGDGGNAYGLGQANRPSKMNLYGADWRTNAIPQMKFMQAYAKERYGSAANAWAFWQARHWW